MNEVVIFCDFILDYICIHAMYMVTKMLFTQYFGRYCWRIQILVKFSCKKVNWEVIEWGDGGGLEVITDL
jgi:hypothetical protein